MMHQYALGHRQRGPAAAGDGKGGKGGKAGGRVAATASGAGRKGRREAPRVRAAAAARKASASSGRADRVPAGAPRSGGLAALGRLTALTQSLPSYRSRQTAEAHDATTAPRAGALEAPRAASRPRGDEEGDAEEAEEGIDDADNLSDADDSDDDADGNGADEAVPCTAGEDATLDPPPRQLHSNGDGRPATLMTAMARLPPMISAGSNPGGGGGGSQRAGGSGRHGVGALTTRLQRVVQRAGARQSEAVGKHRRLDTGVDATSWDAVLRGILVGEPSVEAGLYLWKCRLVDGADGDGGDVCVGGDDDDRSAVIVLTRGERARELRLEPGVTVALRAPWNEVETQAVVRTGFKRRRVIIASHIARA